MNETLPRHHHQYEQQQHQMQLIFNHRINFQAYIPLASLLSRLYASSSFSSLPLLIWFSVYPIYQYTRKANAHTRGHHGHTTPQYELRCGVCVYERDLVLHSISIYGKKFRQTFAFHGSQQTEHCVAILVQHRYTHTHIQIHICAHIQYRMPYNSSFEFEKADSSLYLNQKGNIKCEQRNNNNNFQNQGILSSNIAYMPTAYSSSSSLSSSADS